MDVKMRGTSSETVSHGGRRQQFLGSIAIEICFAAANFGTLIQADKIQTILGAAKIQEVEPIWSSIFAKVNTRTPPRRCFKPPSCTRELPLLCDVVIQVP